MKTTITALWLMILLSAVVYLFWQSEWKYSLPTPVPANYAPVKTGDYIKIKSIAFKDNSKPVLIHFFNPDCPCSRFNVPHIKSLIKKYNQEMNFAIVVLENDKKYTVKEIQEKFGMELPVSFDKSIAVQCGVYSTPQAVILDSQSRLYYRGNYNKSRYCTNTSSNYAQIAIDSLLNKSANPHFNQYALKAYGCSLPNCTK
jgi:hypothetical protein